MITFNNNSNRTLSQKYYCQPCKKQCKDENGYALHLNTNSHLKNMEIIMKDPEYYINKYSNNFKQSFISILNLPQFKNKYTNADKVYLEYIKNRDFVNLNSTKWKNLTRFIKDMEKKELIDVVEDSYNKKLLIRCMDNDNNNKLIKDKIDNKEKYTSLISKDIENVEYINKIRKEYDLKDINSIQPWTNLNYNLDKQVDSTVHEDINLLNNKRKLKDKLIKKNNNDTIIDNENDKANKKIKYNVPADKERSYSKYTQEFPNLYLDNNSNTYHLKYYIPWLNHNLLVKLIKTNNIEYKDNIYKIIKVEDLFNAYIRLYSNDNKNVDLISCDQVNLIPVCPKLDDIAMILYGELIYSKVKIINISSKDDLKCSVVIIERNKYYNCIFTDVNKNGLCKIAL